MKRRFTDDELFQLRNCIPVEMLIKEKLNLPSKMIEGYFRFLCPVCQEFQTATNPNTNLARCFRCERNFNPIDLVMVVKGMRFVESVNYLKPLLPGPTASPAASPKAGAEELRQLLATIGQPIRMMTAKAS